MNSQRDHYTTLGLALLVAVVFPLSGEANQKASGKTQLRNLPRLTDVRLGGELGTRYQAATCNLLTRRDRYSLETFRSSAQGTPGALWWDWPGDQIGRYLSVLHVAAGGGWSTASTLRAGVLDAVLPLQRNTGNFGAENPDRTDMKFISGNAFALRGLLDTYEDTRDQRALDAARRLAHYFESSFSITTRSAARKGQCMSSTATVWMV